VSELGFSPTGKSVLLFLVDGTSTGLLTAEIMNWTGHVLIAPRSRLVDLLKRDEARRTGIYILIGDDPDHPSREMVYIGEGDNVKTRIRAHAEDDAKEFWQRACLITSKDLNLTNANVRYLESKLIGVVRTAGRASLANATSPEIILPDSSDMDYFISQILLILLVVGINAFRVVPVVALVSSVEPPVTRAEEIRLKLSPRKYDYEAYAIERDGEFIVLAGSTAAANPEHSSNQYAALREQLIDDDIIAPHPENSKLLQFTQDYEFKSPSAAAAVINGRNTSGPREWRVESTNMSLKYFRNQELDTIDTDG
jgi:hypothetical protein